MANFRASRFSDEQRALLEQPAFAKLATVGRDGTPRLMVMWYRLAGDELRMVSPGRFQKIRDLERDPRAAMLVEDPTDSYRYLELRGRVELSRDPVRIRDEQVRITTRYIGERTEPYLARRNPHTRVLIIFHPERVRAYDEHP